MPSETLEFRVTGDDHGTMADPVAEVEGGDGRITVTGALSTPTPCQGLEGRHAGRAGRVEIRVVVRPREGGCVQIIGRFHYEAVLRGVEPGPKEVTVIHAYPESGWATDTVATAAVQVR